VLSANTIVLFMLSALALNISPGPSILFILSRCMSEGRRAAIVSVFGLATASLLQAVATAFGLATLFVYSPVAFALVKYCGAAYLVYLGLRGLVAGGVAGGAAATPREGKSKLATAYWQGVLTDLLNPKLLLFFFAFLPQFVEPESGNPRSQMLFLGLLFQVTAIPTNLAVAFAGGSLADLLGAQQVLRATADMAFERSTNRSRSQARALGAALISTATALALARVPRLRKALCLLVSDMAKGSTARPCSGTPALWAWKASSQGAATPATSPAGARPG
jgi:threonine/homoserine/homoserine lactone efflux protein